VELEHFPIPWHRKTSLDLCFIAFSSREPESTSLENALTDQRCAYRQRQHEIDLAACVLTNGPELAGENLRHPRLALQSKVTFQDAAGKIKRDNWHLQFKLISEKF
jgi:hypothetical protein